MNLRPRTEYETFGHPVACTSRPCYRRVTARLNRPHPRYTCGLNFKSRTFECVRGVVRDDLAGEALCRQAMGRSERPSILCLGARRHDWTGRGVSTFDQRRKAHLSDLCLSQLRTAVGRCTTRLRSAHEHAGTELRSCAKTRFCIYGCLAETTS